MLNAIGRGMTPAPAPARAKRFYFTQDLAPEVSFSRPSKATCRNANGKLEQVVSDQPRFDHDENGRRLGLLIEGARVNKSTHYNANPTDTNGFTTGGDAAGTLTIVDDSAALAAAGLDNICTSGKVFFADNTAGTTTFYFYFPGSVGNTNPHSVSLYTRAGGSARVARLYIGQDNLNIYGGDWARQTLENQTPDGTGRRLTLKVDAGDSVYFILDQVEEGAFCTSEIVTEGASTTRSSDRVYIDGINQYDWFDETQGTLIARYHLPRLLDIDSYPCTIHDGSSANILGLRLDQTAHDLRAYMRSSGVSVFSLSNGDNHTAQRSYVGGFGWRSGDSAIISSGKTVGTTPASLPSGLNRLEIGARNGGADQIFGHISTIKIGKHFSTRADLGAAMFQRMDDVFACGGQSLMHGHFISQASGSDGGVQKHHELMGLNHAGERSVFLIDGTTGGSAASKTSDGVNYWWDLATNTRGPAFDTFYLALENAYVTPHKILWAQGEQDSHVIGTSTTREEYKAALEAIFNDMRTHLGIDKIYIQPIGRRTSFGNIGGVQTIREVQQEIIAENTWCQSAGEIYDLGLFDAVHLDDAGYVTAAARNVRAILDSVTGPQISHAIRSGTNITITLSHDQGSDVTPASGIEGFIFHDDGVPIVINAAVRTDANTVTLTLASAPSGVETLYYAYDDMNGLNPANVLRDNSADALPLKPFRINL